jgi:hypothetical protein
LIATQEYGHVKPALQAALTLNTTDTISFVGKYKSAIWKNLTQDIQEPFEKAKFVTERLFSGLHTVLLDEIV